MALMKSDVDQEPTIVQPRQPRNMEDLLRYAIEAESLGATGPPVHDVGPLDPEKCMGHQKTYVGIGAPPWIYIDRRQFLENVITSMTVDVGKELKKALEILRSNYKPGDSVEQFEDSLEVLLDYIDNIDIANDFFKLGGFDVCKQWLEKGPPGMRWRSANVIGDCCQNNPFCQGSAVEMGLLKMLMDMTLRDPDEMVRIKTFHAVSCIVRNNDEGLLKFLSLNGHKLILESIKAPSNRLKTKASFFVSAIANKEGMLKDQLWDIGVVTELISLIDRSVETRLVEDVACFEQCLSALLCLLRGTKKKVQQQSALLDKLSELARLLDKNPSYLESVEYIKLISQEIDGSTKKCV